MRRWDNPRRHPARFKPQWWTINAAYLGPATDGTSGSFHYAHAFGVRSLDTHEPLEMNNMLYIASCTKLMTSIAAMQCVECGLVTLDTDVAEILPELADQGILTGFDEASGEPILNKRQNTITLR